MAVQWWEWQRAQDALEGWVRALIGERPYTIEFQPGAGSSVTFSTRALVVDPIFPDQLGGARLVPYRWRGHTIPSLPQLQWNTARALARHEAAHILYTDPGPMRGETHHWLVNALEDGRIERALGASMPWAWADFVALGRLIWQQFTLGSTREQRLLQACLLQRWDVLRPRGAPSRLILPSPADQERWTQIRPLVEEAWYAATTGVVSAIALRILELIGIPEGQGLIAGLPTLDAGSRGVRPADDPAGRVVGDTTLGLSSSPDRLADLPTSMDQELDDLVTSTDLDPSDGELYLHPYRALERQVLGDVRRLVAALTPPTPNVALRPNDQLGRFSARQYVRTQGEKPLLHTRDVAPSPQGLALVILIDRTGSMQNNAFHPDGTPAPGFFDPRQGRMVHARTAVLLLERTCALHGIPLCIGYAGNLIVPYHRARSSEAYSRPSPVVWIKEWHTPAHAEGPRALIAGMYGDACDEAVSASLRLAQGKLATRREPTKLVIYVHDGVPTDEPAATVARSVAAVRQQGIMVLGLFVGDQADIGALEAIFGTAFTIGVTDSALLPARLGTIVRRYAGR